MLFRSSKKKKNSTPKFRVLHRLGALLQLGALVAEALVLSLKHLPLLQNCYPSVTKDLVDTGQHAREGDWRRFLLGT